MRERFQKQWSGFVVLSQGNIPQRLYQNGRPANPYFDDDEKLYRRFQDGQVDEDGKAPFLKALICQDVAPIDQSIVSQKMYCFLPIITGV